MPLWVDMLNDLAWRDFPLGGALKPQKHTLAHAVLGMWWVGKNETPSQLEPKWRPHTGAYSAQLYVCPGPPFHPVLAVAPYYHSALRR